MSRSYWLFKTEPSVFSIEDLIQAPGQTSPWDGVRNYEARNFLRDGVKLNDLVFIYHSRCKPPGIVGTAIVTREAYPDPSAWEPDSDYFDPKSHPDKPVWVMVDVRFQTEFVSMIPLDTIRNDRRLEGILVARKGQRLSIQPVMPEHAHHLIALGRLGPDSPIR